MRETLTEGSPGVSWGRLGPDPLIVQSCPLSFYVWLCKEGSQHAWLAVCVQSSEFSVQNSRSLNCWSLRSAFWEQQQQHRGQVRKSMWKRRRLIKETLKTCGCQPALKIPNLTVAQICSEKPGLLGRLTVEGSTHHSKHTDPHPQPTLMVIVSSVRTFVVKASDSNDPLKVGCALNIDFLKLWPLYLLFV